ncbi:pimeloyl-ACP methyl ester carboxylesterase [Paenibacillus taihuensis]|uniref:Pimeloyl-ACP methyl ester carboxylesterase n=1 Tax=Paenibacillus taihuensis TaxID=1156355 RepID=A0A3D9S742_9BACL|nr:alpha/beta hydrolase [Paenibacillus taihuensis]REE85096.1 pimeloyl-ACP methyl ester carboxylesterase [Paenibacillus taihuensis]
MTNQHTEVKVGSVQTEGDILYYETRGQDPPLLMISGGGGDAGFFTRVAEILSDEYKVITYDRRGNSRSSRNEPINFTINQQARDGFAILQAVCPGEPAFVFGNSGGAIIAMEMAKEQRSEVNAFVVHEPPVLKVLPDGAKWQRFFAEVYRVGWRYGHRWAMLKFGLSTKIPSQTYKAVPKELSERIGLNHEYFVKHEMLAFTNYSPDYAALQSTKAKIFMAVGETTRDKKLYYGRTAQILAEKLGCELVRFPGNHLSYLDMPREWAEVLRATLQRAK